MFFPPEGAGVITRQAYVLDDHELAVFWTPKAACTSIVHQLCFTVLEQDLAQLKAEEGGARGWLQRHGYWRIGEDARRICEDGGYTSIALLREPYDRLIGAYVNKFVRNRRTALHKIDDLEPFAREFFDTATGRGETDLTFRRFVEVVCDVIDGRGDAEPDLNHHWNTQVPFSFAEPPFGYDRLFGLSNAPRFFETLATLTGRPVENQVTNRTRYRQVDGPNVVDVARSDLLAAKAHPKEAFEDERLRVRVATSFAIDYEMLGRAEV